MSGATGSGGAKMNAVCDNEAEPSVEELFKDAENAFGEIFSVKAPRDVFAGLFSGLKCVLSGMMLALAGVVVQPYEGARDAGLFGCFRGFALGMCTGLFFAVTGFGAGVFQAVRGVIATPRALCMVQKGWKWDSEQHDWGEPKIYSLSEEAARVLAEGEDDEADNPRGSNRQVADLYYYELLNVSPSASQRQIRQAYFSSSRQWHPDKTSEPNAKERFQAISEAYQVLSDETRRRAYDANGRSEAGDNFVDAHVFFSVLFGADLLEPFVGRLRLGDIFNMDLLGGDDSADSNAADDLAQQSRDSEKAAARQVRRQVKLAVDLAERLEPYVRGEVSSFRDAAQTEARGILQRDPSLDRFVSEIGWVYRNRSELYLARWHSRFGGLGLQAMRARLRRGGREATQMATTAKLALRSFSEIRKIVQEADVKDAEDKDSERKPEASDSSTARDHESEAERKEASSSAQGARSDETEGEDELVESITNALPTFMETLWSFSAHDITGTLDKVIERVLSDGSVGYIARERRAQGLEELGEAFMLEAEASRKGERTEEDASQSQDERSRKRFEEAFIASLGSSPGSSR